LNIQNQYSGANITYSANPPFQERHRPAGPGGGAMDAPPEAGAKFPSVRNGVWFGPSWFGVVAPDCSVEIQ
jgi:hypothetical protein